MHPGGRQVRPGEVQGGGGGGRVPPGHGPRGQVLGDLRWGGLQCGHPSGRYCPTVQVRHTYNSSTLSRLLANLEVLWKNISGGNAYLDVKDFP